MWGIIINPRSGKKALRMQRKYLFKTLRTEKIPFIYQVTAYAGHATEIAYDYIKHDIKHILILGGDGTISEVVNGIFQATSDASDITIAIIPRGTGNDWGRYWGLTKDYKASIDAFLKGKCQQIDIGRITYQRNKINQTHFFINSVGIGLDCKVVTLTHTLKYYFGSHALLYFVSLIAAVCTFKSKRIKLIADNQDICNDKILTMNIGNGCYSGGGMKQNPDAKPTDGIFHGMYVGKITFMDVLHAIPRLFNGGLSALPFVHNIEAKKIQIETAKYIPFEADGIVIDACGPYTIDVLHNALKMLIP